MTIDIRTTLHDYELSRIQNEIAIIDDLLDPILGEIGFWQIELLVIEELD